MLLRILAIFLGVIWGIQTAEASVIIKKDLETLDKIANKLEELSKSMGSLQENMDNSNPNVENIINQRITIHEELCFSDIKVRVTGEADTVSEAILLGSLSMKMENAIDEKSINSRLNTLFNLEILAVNTTMASDYRDKLCSKYNYEIAKWDEYIKIEKELIPVLLELENRILPTLSK